MTEEGIERHRWGYYSKTELPNKLIATCIASTLYEAESYFEDIGLVVDSYVEIKIINQNKKDE
jgi:hypothetical protein